jgi:predicted RNA-binding Zn-ribbon protein involved in translation (DUF1610 family)
MSESHVVSGDCPHCGSITTIISSSPRVGMNYHDVSAVPLHIAKKLESENERLDSIVYNCINCGTRYHFHIASVNDHGLSAECMLLTKKQYLERTSKLGKILYG